MTGDDDTHFLATFLLWIKKGKANSKLTTRRPLYLEHYISKTLFQILPR